ncbi:hypothetical protein NVS55_04935 [Myxococcus stipitatus]
MDHTSASQSRCHVTTNPSRIMGYAAGLLGLLVLGIGTGACGVAIETVDTDVARARRGELSSNGLSTNGLSTNGLSTNGLSTNGLSTNGLSTNGFATWFNQDPATADSVMEYVVKCAVPSGQVRQFTNPLTGTLHTWNGALGLAPDWAAGSAATTVEQEVISACLAAHANKYGIHVAISVLGNSAASGTPPIPYTQEELATFSEPESCFFGNLFDGTGVFAANDQPYLPADRSTSRTCGLASGPTQSCPPLTHLGMCASLCQRAVGSGGAALPYYATCTHAGRAFHPLTARLRPQDIYQCGDGICQFTEHCGTGTSASSCQSDCGTCP